jgi:hypothetical protein
MNSATRAARTSVFILIMLSPSLECAAAQTTIVVLRTSTEIVAGSDSKERLPNGDSVVGCKVPGAPRETPRIYFQHLP